MARRGSPARLIVALSVAAVLAVFLLYTSIAGGGTPSLQPSQVAGHSGRVSLVGIALMFCGFTLTSPLPKRIRATESPPQPAALAR